MTVGGGGAPGWALDFIAWMHPAALLLAVAMPVAGAGLRKLNGISPCFSQTIVFHDAAAGFTLPSFVALVLSGLSPEIARQVDGHGAFLAGTLGIVYTIASMFKGHGHGSDSSDKSR